MSVLIIAADVVIIIAINYCFSCLLTGMGVLLLV